MADWSKIKSKGNVLDRRGKGSFSATGLGGGLGIVGTLIVLAFTIFSGGEINVQDLLSQFENIQVNQQTTDSSEFEGEDDYEKFASRVLGSNNDMWRDVFKRSGYEYKEPTLVLFRSGTRSGCGVATSAVGPHYCPADETIYIDETFYDELVKRFGAKGGDVAEAYVMSHEVGHHVQKLLGTMDQVNAARGSSKANDLSIKLELQADCFAGLWANSIRSANIFGPREIQEAIDAAAAVGDDRIQSKTTGSINPESWTHGSSAERVKWFSIGYDNGQVDQCDTFEQ